MGATNFGIIREGIDGHLGQQLRVLDVLEKPVLVGGILLAQLRQAACAVGECRVAEEQESLGKGL